MSDFFGNLAGLFTGSTGVDAAKQTGQIQSQLASKSAKKQTQMVGGGYDTGIATQKQGLPYFQNIYDQGVAPTNTYFSALMGGQGATDAFNQYMGSTGATAEHDIGLEGISRVGASTGQFGSSLMGAADYLTGDIQKHYDKWLEDLSRGIGMEEFGATGVGGLYKGIGAEQINKGKDLAQIQKDKYAATSAARTNAIAGTYAAESGGAANTVNALFSIAELAMAPMTGGASLAGSAMSGLFGGGGTAGIDTLTSSFG
jgi:hypothetical protein